jgi:pimeloyl-ACP methyl ester carboxylesterase
MTAERGSGPTVLLVEADADERGLFGTWLEEEGFGLLTCPGPTEPDYTCIGARTGACPLATEATVVVLDMSLDSEAVVMGTAAEDLLGMYLISGHQVIVLGSHGGEEIPGARSPPTPSITGGADRGRSVTQAGRTTSDVFLRDHEIHRITVDRPRVGFSDLLSQRKLVDWPDDVVQLADRLGLKRFAVLGVSASALACAWALPDRVTAVALVSGLGPMDRPRAFEGMNRSAGGVMILGKRVPWLGRLLGASVVAADRLRPGTALRGLLKALPEPDRLVVSRPEVRRSLLESYALAFRQGARGQVQDWAILASSWGFRPEYVTVPIRLFHGEIDDRVPLHHAEHLARAIPDCHLAVYPGEGHMIIFDRARRSLVAC